MSSQAKRGPSDPTEIAGRYEVVQKLGAGAFGTVYKAKDKVLGRMLAIKTVRVEALMAAGASLDEMMDRFKREAQVSAQLKHPHIVTIYDIGESDGLTYLAMEFLEGIGLDKVIAEAGKLSVERAALLGSQVAEALDFAHRNNVVHRDIKPANIMIESGDRVKVTDFGIAKVTDSSEHLTMTGSLLGTPSYMSPEQARGGALDGRSDLFSLGCVLYEMVAGKKAFRGDSITALIFKIITEEPPSLRDLEPSISDQMLRIIAKSMSKSPETRYQSGRELSEDLLQLTRAGSLPTIRTSETPTSPIRPDHLGTSPTIATMGTAQSLNTLQTPATVVSGGVARPQPPTPGIPPMPTPPQRPASPASRPPVPQAAARRSGGGGLLIVGVLVVLVLGVLVVGGGVAWWFLHRPPVEQADNSSSLTTSTDTEPTPSAVPTADVSTAPSVGPQLESSISPSASPSAGPGSQIASRTTPPPAVDLPPTNTTTTPQTGHQQTQGTGRDYAYLDEEPSNTADGRVAGEELASKYRSGSGGSSGLQSGARFHARPRSPRPLAPAERPAVAVMRHIMNALETYKKRTGRYGSLKELANAQTLFLDVPYQATTFTRRGYAFNLKDSAESFELTATPMGMETRPFIGDDSGFIRTGTD